MSGNFCKLNFFHAVSYVPAMYYYRMVSSLHLHCVDILHESHHRAIVRTQAIGSPMEQLVLSDFMVVSCLKVSSEKHNCGGQ